MIFVLRINRLSHASFEIQNWQLLGKLELQY